MNISQSSSLGRDAWVRLRANRMAMVSLFLLVAISFVSLFGPLLSSYSYDQQNLDHIFKSPDSTHLFGTDNLGRDLFARTTYGGRISLAVGLLATLVSLIIGVTYGMLSGYAGGRIDSWMMRFVDVLYSLPFIIFVILLMVIFGSKFPATLFGHWGGGMADYGPDNTCPNLAFKKCGVYRGRPGTGLFSCPNPFSPSSPQPDWSHYHLRNPYCPCGHAARSSAEFSRTGGAGTHEFLG